MRAAGVSGRATRGASVCGSQRRYGIRACRIHAPPRMRPRAAGSGSVGCDGAGGSVRGARAFAEEGAQSAVHHRIPSRGMRDVCVRRAEEGDPARGARLGRSGDRRAPDAGASPSRRRLPCCGLAARGVVTGRPPPRGRDCAAGTLPWPRCGRAPSKSGSPAFGRARSTSPAWGTLEPTSETALGRTARPAQRAPAL